MSRAATPELWFMSGRSSADWLARQGAVFDRPTPKTRSRWPNQAADPAEQLALLPFLTDVKALANETVAATPCRVLTATPKPEARTRSSCRRNRAVMDSESDSCRCACLSRRKGTDVQVELVNPQFARHGLPEGGS